ASSKMSPVFILSRLCLKRRFQFFGIAVPPPVNAFVTFLTISSLITCRRPTASAFSHGTLTVMSLCRILIVRYSRFSPKTTRFSFLTIVPAPWCGYTTLSPTLNKPSSPTGRGSTRQDADRVNARRAQVSSVAKVPQIGHFSEKSLLVAELAFLTPRWQASEDVTVQVARCVR